MYSTNTASYCLAIAALTVWQKFLRWLAIFSDEDKAGHFCRRYGPGGKFEQEHGFCADPRDIADYVARCPHGTMGSCDHRAFERFVCERHAPRPARTEPEPQPRGGFALSLGFRAPLLGSAGGIVLLVIAGAAAVFLMYSLWNTIKPYLVSGIVMCFLAYMFAATNKAAGIVYTVISLAILNNLVSSGEMEPICGVFFFICTVVTTVVCIKNCH